MSDADPTVTLLEGYEDLDHDVKKLALKTENSTGDLRAAIDSILGTSSVGNAATVDKEWLALCLLALGGPDATGIDVERADQ